MVWFEKKITLYNLRWKAFAFRFILELFRAAMFLSVFRMCLWLFDLHMYKSTIREVCKTETSQRTLSDVVQSRSSSDQDNLVNLSIYLFKLIFRSSITVCSLLQWDKVKVVYSKVYCGAFLSVIYLQVYY